MGTRLRRLKTKMRGQKLSDGKPLCGRNKLTEAEIDRLQAYYGLAIRRNLSSVKDMQQAIWTIFLHKLSTDEKPQHGFCPPDSDTWCKFKKAELLGETYHHKNSLPVDVVEAMRPVFRDLANPELLKKCLHGGTQNPNESVNNVIWSRVPKKTFVQLEVLSLGTYDAVSSFNMGNVSKLEILRKMCIEPGDYTVQAMECLDKQRLLRAKYYCLQKTKENEGVNINVTLFSSSTAFGNWPRQARSSNEASTSALKFHTPHQWEKARALDRFNVHRSPTRWVFSGLELMTRRQRFRYIDH
ncbi:uncharacterized protein TNCV_3177451 [Trichonephila clavipes]|nr:uncharacterized protein TNCV_3177451 [Trichonephila clavipes]